MAARGKEVMVNAGTRPAISTRDLTARGVRYHLRLAGEGPALLLLHGFTGSAAAWDAHLATLARGRRAIAVDLLGHGGTDSPPAPERYRVEQAAADLLALLDALEIPETAVLGYSMGGRLALRLALEAPDRVRALILESASAGIAERRERSTRVRGDEALAASIERDGMAAFITHWEGLSLFASQASLSPAVREALRSQRLTNLPHGLANSLRGMGAGVAPPLQKRLAELSMPVLLIAGALDLKYVASAGQMEPRIPGAALAIVPEAGHTVHLEQPAAFDRLVDGFLTTIDR